MVPLTSPREIYFPHPLVHPSRIHDVNLIVGPVVAGSMMAFVGAALRKQEKTALQFESFGYGFAFAFGVALANHPSISMPGPFLSGRMDES